MADSRSFPDGKKVYVLDTSVLMHDPETVEKISADGNIVVISVHVLKELDKSKKFQDQKGANSRFVSRVLDEYRSQGSLNVGIPTKSGGIIVVDCDGHEEYFQKYLSGLEKTVDNRIIATALLWKYESNGKYEKVALLSKDINLRVVANAFDLDAEDYERDKRIRRIEELYTGSTRITMSDEDTNLLLINFPKDKVLQISRLCPENQKKLNKLLPNECLHISISGKDITAIFKKKKQELRWIKRSTEMSKNKKVMPVNIEQTFEYELLTDDEVSIVTVVGGAGTGKTLISLLAGIDQVEAGKYKTVLVYRPNIEIGTPLGFLPGDIGQKFAPWMLPIIDNLSLITGLDDYDETCGKKGEISKADAANITLDYLTGPDGYLKIHPMNFVRGRSLNNAFVIVDEAQNLTPHQVKTIVTRAGKNTKFVLTGDCTQIDTPYLDPVSNGLSHTVERLKGQEKAGNIMLKKGERSALADMAAELL